LVKDSAPQVSPFGAATTNTVGNIRV